MRALAAVTVVALPLVVAACRAEPVPCDASALVGGVTVEVPGRDPQAMGAVEVCLPHHCAPAMPWGEHALLASGATLDSTDPVAIDVTVVGRREFHETVAPTVITSGPDGDPCQKRAVKARVILPQP